MIYPIILIIVIISSFNILKDFKRGVNIVIALRLLIPASVRLIGVGISLNSFLTILLLISFLIHKEYRKRMPSKLQIIIILFLLSSIMLTPYALNMTVIDQIKKMINFFIVDMLMGILSWYGIQNKEDFKKLLKTLFITFCIIGIYGIYEYVSKSNPYANWATEYFGAQKNFSTMFLNENRGFLVGRIMGTSFHPLAWGLIMGTAFSFFNNNLFLLGKKNYIILLPLILINIFLCGSRSAIIMVITYITIRIFNNIKKNLKKIIIFLVICTCITPLLPKTKDTKAFINTIESSIFFWNENKSKEAGVSGSSVSMRWEQLIFSFYLIQDSFLTGNGYGFSDIAQTNTTGKYEKMMGFESILFTKIVNQGILGLLFFFIFYFNLLKYTRHLTKNKIERGKIYGLYSSYLIGIIFTGLQNSFFIFFVLVLMQTKWYYLQRKSKVST